MRTPRRCSIDSPGTTVARALCVVIVLIGAQSLVAAQTSVAHSASSVRTSSDIPDGGCDSVHVRTDFKPALLLSQPKGGKGTYHYPRQTHKSDRRGIFTTSYAVQTLRANSAPGPRAFDEFGEEDKDKVSVTRAALSSLVLPGAGQWYAGARGRSAVFLGVEGLGWAAFGFFETVGATKNNEYRTYAQVHAGVNPAGKGDEFYRTITFYESQDEYNGIARLFNPTRPYISSKSDSTWQWDSPAARVRFRALRNQSSEGFNRAKFMIGALALNRLVGALDAIRTAKMANRRSRMEGADWKIHLRGNPYAHNPNFAFVLSRRF